MVSAALSSSRAAVLTRRLIAAGMVLVAGVLLNAVGAVALWTSSGTWATGGDGIGPGLRLVMVDDIGCQYCRKWDAEVGGLYERSAVGKVAPLERRQKRHRDLAPYEPLVYTPTFILIRDGAEIGRIVGYPGADFFWAELERLIAKAGPLPPDTRPDPPVAPRDAAAEPPNDKPQVSRRAETLAGE